MSDFFDKAAERDDALVKGLSQAARTTRMELREWVEMELKAVLVEAELQEGLLDGEIGHRVHATIERLRVINHRDLPEAITNYDDAMTDVLQGGFADVHDAYDLLQKECPVLVRIVRELLDIRNFIGELGGT